MLVNNLKLWRSCQSTNSFDEAEPTIAHHLVIIEMKRIGSKRVESITKNGLRSKQLKTDILQLIIELGLDAEIGIWAIILYYQ